jgi:hypothetical protein
MKKIPGESLERFGEMEEKEQHQVRIAFLNALWYVTPSCATS